jgi:hypothetical protein
METPLQNGSLSYRGAKSVIVKIPLQRSGICLQGGFGLSDLGIDELHAFQADLWALPQNIELPPNIPNRFLRYAVLVPRVADRGLYRPPVSVNSMGKRVGDGLLEAAELTPPWPRSTPQQ